LSELELARDVWLGATKYIQALTDAEWCFMKIGDRCKWYDRHAREEIHVIIISAPGQAALTPGPEWDPQHVDADKTFPHDSTSFSTRFEKVRVRAEYGRRTGEEFEVEQDELRPCAQPPGAGPGSAKA